MMRLIYLDPLDHWMAEWGFEMVRYADDFVVLCRDRREAEEALAKHKQRNKQELKQPAFCPRTAR
jgi:retron-type reverse transcriptase